MALKKTQNDFRHKTSEAYLRRGEEKKNLRNIWLQDTGENNLAQAIDVYFVDDITGAISKADLTEANYKGTLAELFANNKSIYGTLKDGDSKNSALVLKMKENAGNVYKDKENQFDLWFSLKSASAVNVTE